MTAQPLVLNSDYFIRPSSMEKNNFHTKNKDTVQFMLSEFQSAWNMLEALDNRRGTYFNYYMVAFSAAMGFSLNSIKEGTQEKFTLILILILCLAISIAGIFLISALVSENKANVRYRNKINYIRELFLDHNDSEEIKKYIRLEKHMGTKLFSYDPTGLCDIGNTLKMFIAIILVEVLASVVIGSVILCNLHTV